MSTACSPKRLRIASTARSARDRATLFVPTSRGGGRAPFATQATLAGLAGHVITNAVSLRRMGQR